MRGGVGRTGPGCDTSEQCSRLYLSQHVAVGGSRGNRGRDCVGGGHSQINVADGRVGGSGGVSPTSSGEHLLSN